MTRAYRADEAVSAKPRTVEETPDFWIIRDCIAAKEGVLRGAKGDEYLSREELERSWQYWEGVPLMPFHPSGPSPWEAVPLLPISLGRVRNVRLRAEDAAVLYDAHLLRHEGVPGMRTTADVVQHNRDLVEAVRRGEQLDNSTGSSCFDKPRSGSFQGRQYASVRTSVMPTHVAAFGPGVRGNCGWKDGCGLARAASDILHSQGQLPPQGWSPHQTVHEDTTMADDKNPPVGGAAGAPSGVLVVHADAARMQALEQKLALLEPRAARADALELTTKKLQDELTAASAKIDKLVTCYEGAESARLGGKRALLARARGVNADSFTAYPEVALDKEIELETQRRAKGDGMRFHAPAVKADDAKQPYHQMADGGFMAKSVSASKEA